MAENNGSTLENRTQAVPAAVEHTKTAAGKELKKTTIGGQALIEGLMMVGPRRIAMAIRKSDGSILVEEIAQGRKMVFFEKLPFFRGGIRLFRQLVTGTGALMKSAEFSEETPPVSAVTPTAEEQIPEVSQVAETEAGGADTDAITEPQTENRLSRMADDARTAAQPPKPVEKQGRLDAFLEKNMNIMIVIFALLGILFSVALFMLLPRLIIDFISNWIPASKSDSISVNLILNLAEGILRIAIFIGYLALTSRIKDIARVWMYHGAEHKTIACYEAGEPLTVANVRKFSRFHPRCGTAFLFVVVIVSILVFCIAGVFIGVNWWWLNALIRLALVPVVAGIAYEIIHFTGKHDTNVICRSVSKPGLWMQRFTTREPDDSMLEVAIAAVQAVLPENEGEDTW